MQLPDKSTGTPPSKGNVKMPKLVITKYDGTSEKWLSFWNKFEGEIDAADIPGLPNLPILQNYWNVMCACLL